VNNFRKVMTVMEGKMTNAKGIFMTGLVDCRKAEFNTDKVEWIEEYDKVPHKEGGQVYMAVFQGQKRILLFREFTETEKAK